MKCGHDVDLIHPQCFGIERLVLLEELMEAGVGIELVETLDKLVDVCILPAVGQFCLVADELDLALVDFEVYGHVGHFLVTDAAVGTQVLIVGNSGVGLMWGEPRLCILCVLSGQVVAVLLEACRAR